MTPNHPLNNNRLYDEFNGYDPTELRDFLTGSYSIFEAADMRAAYDLGRDEQLEQIQESIDELVFEYTIRGNRDAENDELLEFISNLKRYMRPTDPQEDNS